MTGIKVQLVSIRRHGETRVLARAARWGSATSAARGWLRGSIGLAFRACPVFGFDAFPLV